MTAEQLQLDTTPTVAVPSPGMSPDGQAAPDPYRVDRPVRIPAGLEPFVEAGVLAAADVHVATTLCRLAGDDRPDVLLAAALAARAPRRQHVCVELRHAAATVTGDDPTAGPLPWPQPDQWREQLLDSPLVAVRAPGDLTLAPDRDIDVVPLVLADDRLYLDRYWRYERQVAATLRQRAGIQASDVAVEVLQAGLDRLAVPDDQGRAVAPDRQRVAAATAVLRHLAVIAGGPGTGKTTTVAQILALLDEQAAAAAARPPRTAVAAPTGKAAQRLTEALQEAAGRLPVADGIRDRLAATEASTLHRLLGHRPGSATRFLHDRDNPLPYDVVVVDETSMVSLALMAKLLDAVPPTARLVLVGDPDQLESVEAGSVLADVVGRSGRPAWSPAWRHRLGAVVGEAHLADLPATDMADSARVDDAIVVLDRVHRFKGGIAELAAAVQAGDPERALALLDDREDLTWLRPDDEAGMDALRQRVVAQLGPVVRAARAGDAATALRLLDELRILCAHRRGDDGVTGWVARVQRWLLDALPDLDLSDRWYPGRPVLVTENDHQLGLFNGDVGVAVVRDGRVQVAFPGATGLPRWFGPARLPEHQTVHAMTIHKSQGSQLTHAVVALPARESPILTRELLYTAVTRARTQVTVIATEPALRTAISRRVRRASGLEAVLR